MGLEFNKPQYALAAYSKDSGQIKRSSSGGIFIELAKYIISMDGVVYATSFDLEYSVCFTRADSINKVFAQMGSKYIQSHFIDQFDMIINDLKNGKHVLFIGTPCQVAALRSLCVNYDNLLLVDIICHGTPSPKVWKDYLLFFKNKKKLSSIDSINFRNKEKGWDKSFASCISKGKEYSMQPYMEMYGERTIIRPSCYKCPFCKLTRISDITIGDFWGIKDFDEQWYVPTRGTSLILCNTDEGNVVLNSIKNCIEFKQYEVDSIPLQMNLRQPTPYPVRRKKFWSDYNNKGFKYIVGVYGGDHGVGRIKKRIHKVLLGLKAR